jgi:hypothetical protein
MVALNPEHVVVDADHFEQMACAALRRSEIHVLEAALAVYRGDLLPEDRYADWCAPRRDSLADLRLRLLLGMADLLEARGAYNDAADRLRAVLRVDPAREEVHRRLMRLYAEMGTPDQAVRQFHACEDVLLREFDFAPQEETVAVYHDVVAHRTARREASSSQAGERTGRSLAAPIRPDSLDPFVGRADLVGELCRQLARPAHGGGMVLVSGEAGIGKTRLLEEVANRAVNQGAVVFRGGAGALGSNFACGPLAVALEGYVAGRPLAERQELARCYPSLSGFVPSLVVETGEPRVASAHGEESHVVAAIVRLLTDTAREHPVLLVLDDLREADGYSLDVIGYLAHLAIDRRWLLVGSVREEEIEPGSGVARLLAKATREGLCRRIELQWLPREQCDQLVAAMLPSASVNRELLDRIYARSRGNPLFARELVAEVRAQGQPGDRNARARGAAVVGECVPGRIRALAETQFTSLDSTAQRILLLVAAAGATEVSFADLRSGATALDPPVGDWALLDALDRAVETRLLEERKSGFAFRHPLVRSALYERLSRHRRAQLGYALQHSSAASRLPA